MKLNDFIKTRRLELKLTLQNIADATNVGKGTVQKWESGEISDMRRSKIAALAKVLDVSPALLLKDEIFDVIPYGSQNQYTQREINIIKKYRQLDDDGKEEIEDILDIKLKKQLSKSKVTQNRVG